MPLLDIQNVSRSYGGLKALRDVTLRLEPGAIGLVGNNGAGKSTLLRVLLGLIQPDSGSGTLLGYDIRRASRELRGKVGYLPESAAMVPSLKGVEYVSLAGDLYGMPHRDARRRAHEVLNYVGIGELRYRKLEEYSTGNQQRLKFAAAIVHDPQLLLLDEPTNGLDPRGRQEMLALIKDLIVETGKSVILCTHLLGDVEKICEQVVVLHGGTVVEAGKTAELRRGAGNQFEIDCEGNKEKLWAGLRSAGVEIKTRRNGVAVAVTPADWTSERFFHAAREAEVLLTHLKPDEEDLNRLFLRVTQGAAAPTSVSSETERGTE